MNLNKGDIISDFAGEFDTCAKVNNRLRELSYQLKSDSEVEYISVCNVAGMRVYETTLRYVILMAAYQIDSSISYRYTNSVNRSYLLSKLDGSCLVENDLIKLQTRVAELIKSSIPIRRIVVSKEEAVKIFEKQKMYDKIKNLKYRELDSVNLYECDGYYNYLYGYMMDNTKRLYSYKLILHNPGILVSYPRYDIDGKLPDYQPNKVFDRLITETSLMADDLKINDVAALNTIVEEKKDLDLINLSESIHNRDLCHLVDDIESKIRKIKMIFIAGPSSSGKTTFANRLRIELKSRSINPTMISLDDYYLRMEDIPLQENGDKDFETIKAFDIERFNQDMLDLISGKIVLLRERDMKSKEVIEFGRQAKLEQNSVIIVEGIHALNDSISKMINNAIKYKIYISPILALNIDNHSPINLSDARMLRRIVRDHKFRNLSVERTLQLWNSVRQGEFKWIYPFSTNVDYVFNSNLFYELSVMKKYAFDTLNHIDDNSEYFIEANRILKFLKYLKEIDDKFIPSNSILKEFIGGSSYQ